MDKYDYIIVGAGIVGLATAIKLYKINAKSKILVLEKEKTLGVHQTGNNSGVIHSGIYYKPGSKKAINCRKGYELLLDFLRENEIKHDICGKLIVAADDIEAKRLKEIYRRGLNNGLQKLRMLNSEEEIKDFEPNAVGKRGIFVPQTGIVDFKSVLSKYFDILRNLNCEFQFNSFVVDIIEKTDSVIAITPNKSFTCKKLITCGGLNSDKLAKMNKENLSFRIIPFRGEYYKLSENKKGLVHNLLYPVPDPSFPFLGVHFTRKINGDIEAGPNAVLAFKREGYSKFSFNLNDTLGILSWPGFLSVAKKYWRTGAGEIYRSFSKRAFTKALQKLIPSIRINNLVKGGSGVRAQACDLKGNLLDDFYFEKTKRVLHVCNAPSPAATASLAIGQDIAQLIS